MSLTAAAAPEVPASRRAIRIPRYAAEIDMNPPPTYCCRTVDVLNTINTWLRRRAIYSRALSNMKSYIIQTAAEHGASHHITDITSAPVARSTHVDQDSGRLTGRRGSVDRENVKEEMAELTAEHLSQSEECSHVVLWSPSEELQEEQDKTTRIDVGVAGSIFITHRTSENISEELLLDPVISDRP